ncbi:MAG: c-type cytochrome [Rhizobiaceae bacterium]
MLKFLKGVFVAFSVLCLSAPFASAQDVKAGAKVFKKCRACHTIGEGAKNKVGPHLNGMFGRTAGGIEGFKYSKAMRARGADGLVWNNQNFIEFITKPKKFIKKTRMGFGGLKKEKDRLNLIAFLKAKSVGQKPITAEDESVKNDAPKQPAKRLAKDVPVPSHGVLHLGRLAQLDEVAAWNIDIRPDGQGLPVGSGKVSDGEVVYNENCARCHGDFGEGIGRWPILAGGHDTLSDERPEKTIGSYWPYLSTVYDYVRRAMPFGSARSLNDDDVYALTAYLLFLNDVVEDEDFVLSNENFTSIRLPNEKNFIADNRSEEAHNLDKSEPCMSDCISGLPKVTSRARILDVTPDAKEDENIE